MTKPRETPTSKHKKNPSNCSSRLAQAPYSQILVEFYRKLTELRALGLCAWVLTLGQNISYLYSLMPWTTNKSSNGLRQYFWIYISFEEFLNNFLYYRSKLNSEGYTSPIWFPFNPKYSILEDVWFIQI